jgi:gliding motility-associated-like protein
MLSTVVQQPDPKVSYTWYRNNSFLKDTKTITVGAAGNYFLEAVNQNGCKDTAFIQLATFPLPPVPQPRVADGYNTQFCQGDSTLLQADATNNTGTFKWASLQPSGYVGIADASTAFLTVKKPVDMGSSPSSMKYRVLRVDENNWSANWSDPLEVISLPAPPVSISSNGSPTTICEGSTVLLTAGSVAKLVRYSWTRDGITLQDGLDSFWLARETGAYQLQATNSFSCQSISNKVDILVNKLPPSPVIQPSANIPEIVSQQEVSICAGSSGTLRVSSFSGAVYQWFRDGLAINGANRDSLVVNTPAKYRVSTTLVGCSSLSQETTVGLLPLPNGAMVQPEFPAICLGSDRVLNANGAAGYQWYYNYVPIKGATDSAYRALVPGVYQVEFSSNKGCKKISSNFINLNLIRKPTPRFSVDIYCTGSEATFTNLSQTANSGSVNYLWKFQNGQTDSNFTAKHVFTTSGLYKVCLDVIPVACPQLSDSSVVNIQIEAAPKGIVYPAINAMVGKSISLVARAIGDFYEWKPSTGLNSPFIRIPILNTPPKEQRFTVDITTRSGCRTVDTQTVRVFDEQQIYVAGGFTPNNDGNNDKVYPILVGVAAFRYMKIFNRWGVQVFQTASTDPEQGWDGTYKGVPQPADTYTWVVSAVGDNEREIRKSGSLVLIR